VVFVVQRCYYHCLIDNRSKERLQLISDAVMADEERGLSDTEDRNDDDNEWEVRGKKGFMEEEEVAGINYDQFEVILGAIARHGYRLGGDNVPVETKLR
jgi:hypothetical protein